MNPAPTLSPSDTFAQIMDLACQAIAARSRFEAVPTPYIVLIWKRMRALAALFAVLAARVQARLQEGAMPRARRAAASGGPDVPRAMRKPVVAVEKVAGEGEMTRLPAWLYRRSGWLVLLAPEATVCGCRMQILLENPEVVAMAAASPQMARLLRSVCRALALDPGRALPPLPYRPRPPRAPQPVLHEPDGAAGGPAVAKRIPMRWRRGGLYPRRRPALWVARTGSARRNRCAYDIVLIWAARGGRFHSCGKPV